MTNQKKIWIRLGINTNNIKKYYLLNDAGKSTQISKAKADEMILSGEAKKVEPFWN